MKYTMTPANKRLLAASGILLGLTAIPLQKSVIAQELGSHVHGLTELNLVIANQNVQIEFISPAINLLGFERASNSQPSLVCVQFIRLNQQPKQFVVWLV